MKRKFCPKAINFNLKENEAIDLFKKWYSSFFSPSINRPRVKLDISKIFVPFWIFDVVTKSNYVTNAKFNHRSIEFDHSLNQYSDVLRSKSRVYYAQHYSKYKNNSSEMQIYSSDKLFGYAVNALKNFDISKEKLIDFDDSILLKENAKAEQFKIRPGTVWPFVLKSIDLEERKIAKKRIKEKFQADAVEIKTMELSILARRVKPVFIPAYVINYSTPKMKNQKAVICACGDFKVSGIKEFSALKAFTATAAIAGAINFLAFNYFASNLMFPPFLFTFGPAIFAAWISQIIPRRRLRAFSDRLQSKKKFWRKEEEKYFQGIQRGKIQYDENSKNFDFSQFDDDESFSYYSNLFDEKSEENEKNETEFKAKEEQHKRKISDFKGYYKLLELDPLEGKITASDIRTAFRAQVRKWHPDKAKGDKGEIEKRNRKFKKILEAYQILKNEKKRKLYDNGEENLNDKNGR